MQTQSLLRRPDRLRPSIGFLYHGEGHCWGKR
jgi:hypothetical protein